MKTKSLNLLTKILLIISVFYLFNTNKAFALTSKEEVDEYIRIVEEDFKSKLKENKMKDGRFSFYPYNVYGIDGRKYFSNNCSMIPDNLSEDYYQMEDTVKEVFKEYFDKNLDTSLPDEERLVAYIVTGGNYLYTRQENYKYGDDIEARVGAIVFPASENSVWEKDCEKVYAQEYSKKLGGMFEIDGYATEDYYIHLKMQDGKYIITYLDTIPEGFQDFVERMKTHGIDLENLNYEELINSKSTTEIIAEAVQKENFETKNIIKTKSRINILVIVVCSLGIILTLFINIKCIKKLKKK